MMSYGSTAETSFSLVRTLVAQDPALLAKVDAVLKARGFAKLVTSDIFPSQHRRARAEAVRELRWLSEYLQNVYNRADKFTPHDKPGRRVVIDDEDDEDEVVNVNGNANGQGDASGQVHLSSKSESTRRGSGSEDGSEDGHEVRQPSDVGSAEPFADESGSAEPAEYDHTSEESSGRSTAEPEAIDSRTDSARSPASRARSVPDEPAQAAPQTARPPRAAPEARAESAEELAQSRLLKRQQHAQEREQARKAQEQLRLQREQEKAREEQQRLHRNRERLHEKRQRAAEASDGAQTQTNEEIWCLCREPAYGFMVACANSKCPYEWFHGGCVGLKAAPRARWFCPVCRPRQGPAPGVPDPKHRDKKKGSHHTAASRTAARQPVAHKQTTAHARRDKRRSFTANEVSSAPTTPLRSRSARRAKRERDSEPEPPSEEPTLRKRRLRDSTVLSTQAPASGGSSPASRERRRKI